MKNTIYYFLVLTLFSFTINNWSWPQKLTEKVDKSIKSTFEVEEYTMNEIVVDKHLTTLVPAEMNNKNLFELNKNQVLLGYVYVGKAPSMKNEFDYIIMFDKDFIIKKSKVLIYREMHGQQIGSQRWLKQFIGKTRTDTVELDKNISGISGATISTTAMTKATNDVLKTLNILFENDIF